METLRLGTVPYLNARPLVAGLAAEPGVTLSESVPSELAPKLRAGGLDAALVSAVELFRDPPLSWVPGPAVVSRGPVQSILLFLRGPAREVRTLALDRSSLSAAALTQVCLAEFLGSKPEVIRSAAPDAPLESIDADAVLRIGDPALRTDAGEWQVLDVGQVWTDATGLPFVYALWLVRPDAPGARVAQVVRRAAREGQRRLDDIAQRYGADAGLSLDAARRYLTDVVAWELGPEELEGLATFGKLAANLGLTDRSSLPPAVGT